MSDKEYFDKAASKFEENHQDPLSLEEFIEKVVENPELVENSSAYLLRVIESAGTRTVIEDGEKVKRYKFFDGIYKNGEHAVIGNNKMLNRFVERLRFMSRQKDNTERAIWFEGPTATGKSEWKQCLIDGLQVASQKDGYRRYTIEWNPTVTDSNSRVGYSDHNETRREWERSPIQVSPLSVLPTEVQQDLLDDINIDSSTSPKKLDPASQEYFDLLKEHYEESNTENIFEAITSKDHLRVTNFVVDVGQGIGVLRSEDSRSVPERLGGSWIPSLVQEKGKKVPSAFDFDGVLSEGNQVAAIIEDGIKHQDIFHDILNIIDEQTVEISNQPSFEIDTNLIIISNPDLESKLNKGASSRKKDPYRSVRRRLDKHKFRYLTTPSKAAEVLYRKLTGETERWYPEERKEKMEKRLEISGTELSPHSLEAAALFEVVTRLGPPNSIGKNTDEIFDLQRIDKAQLYEEGVLTIDGEEYTKDELNKELEETIESDKDGEKGILVTYTKKIISEIVQSDDDVILPYKVLDEMKNGLEDEAVFSSKERTEYEDLEPQVRNYIFQRQENEVISSLLSKRKATEEGVERYVDQVFRWNSSDYELEEQEPIQMKVFEKRHLGMEEADYDGETPSEDVKEFRKERIANELSQFFWENKDEEYEFGDIPVTEIEVIDEIVGTYDWNDVKNEFENLNPDQWSNPQSDTETEEAKKICIEQLQDIYGYSEKSAKLTSEHIMEEIEWE